MAKLAKETKVTQLSLVMISYFQVIAATMHNHFKLTQRQ